MPGQDVADLQWLYDATQQVERRDLRDLTIADLDRFKDLRRRFAAPEFKALYSAWCINGDAVFQRANAFHGRLITHVLPSSYSQFGSLPGVV